MELPVIGRIIMFHKQDQNLVAADVQIILIIRITLDQFGRVIPEIIMSGSRPHDVRKSFAVQIYILIVFIVDRISVQLHHPVPVISGKQIPLPVY